MKEPLMVLISDVHFNLKNLDVASTSLKNAIDKAESLRIPLVISGDLNDTKAIIRAEVANKLLELIKNAKTEIYIIVGNHDLINEKGKEHSLNFLSSYAHIVDDFKYININEKQILMIPYQSNIDNLLNRLKIEKQKVTSSSNILITHQGYKGAFMGDCVQDKSSLDPSFVSDFKVFSGHYHQHQDVGTVTYVGSPYTMSFGEANDGAKGFLVVYPDGSYEQIKLNLRKHVKVILDVSEVLDYNWESKFNKNDLIWIIIKGSKKELENVNLQARLAGYNYKLELVCTDLVQITDLKEISVSSLTDEQKFDMFIENQESLSEYDKTELKQFWKTLL